MTKHLQIVDLPWQDKDDGLCALTATEYVGFSIYDLTTITITTLQVDD